MQILGADWGTSSLRTYLLDNDGKVLSSNHSENGLVQAKEKGFLNSLTNTAQDQLDNCELIVLSGMVGAKEGWIEAAYAKLPVTLNDLAKAMIKVPEDSLNAWIIPGLVKDTEQQQDVMRGEETQIFGCLEQGFGDGIYIAPGTHCKWCKVEKQQIIDFQTFFTGDLYNALINASILKLQINDQQSFHKETYLMGLTQGFATKYSGNLLNELFATRVKGVLGKINIENLGSYLSGLLIGVEVNYATEKFLDQEVVLIANHKLAKLYQIALELKNIQVKTPNNDIVVAGQFALAKSKNIN